MQENAHRKESITNIKFYGCYGLMYNGNIALRTIQETIRIIDARKYEKEYNKKKLEYRYDFVDYKARNVFLIKEVIPLLIKYSYGYNHYGLRDSLINDNMVEA